MPYLPGDNFSFDFAQRSGGGESGYGANMLSNLAAGLIQNGTPDLETTVSVAQRPSPYNTPGRLKVSGTIPNTYVIGDKVQIIVVWQDGSGNQDYWLKDLGKLEGTPAAGPIFSITPLQASVTNPRYATRDLAPIAQGSTPIDVWTITDATDAPVNLSGKTVRLVAYTVAQAQHCNPSSETLAPVFKIETGAGITIGGTGNNSVSVAFSALNTATAGQYFYWLLNVTDLLPLANGSLVIKPAVWNK